MGNNKKQNFKTPEGYFENFHERLMQKINAEEDTETLSFLPKSDGFKVPKSYFEGVQERVAAQLQERKTKVIPLHPYRKYKYAIASVAAIFLLFLGLNIRTEAPVAFEDLASAEIDAYLEQTELNLSSYELAEIVSLEGTELNDVMDIPLESENILEYLDENIEDIEELNLNFEDYE